MPPDNLSQNIEFAITFIPFLFGPILLSILLCLIYQIHSLWPNMNVSVSWGVVIEDGVRSVCSSFNNWSFYNLLVFNIEYFN